MVIQKTIEFCHNSPTHIITYLKFITANFQILLKLSKRSTFSKYEGIKFKFNSLKPVR